jgi:hypothetical protein
MRTLFLSSALQETTAKYRIEIGTLIYGGKASDTRGKIRQLSERTLDINQFLVNKVGFYDIGDGSIKDGEV